MIREGDLKRKYLEASDCSGGLRRGAGGGNRGRLMGASQSPLGESINNIPALLSFHFQRWSRALVQCIFRTGERGGG